MDEGVEVLAALEQLVDHALVLGAATASGEMRFRILEPLREEAVARLSEEELLEARGAPARVALAVDRELSVRVPRNRREPSTCSRARWGSRNRPTSWSPP